MHHFSCFSLTFYNQYYARTSQEHDLSIISFFISSIFVLPCWAYIHHEYIYIWKWLSKTSIFFMVILYLIDVSIALLIIESKLHLCNSQKIYLVHLLALFFVGHGTKRKWGSTSNLLCDFNDRHIMRNISDEITWNEWVWTHTMFK